MNLASQTSAIRAGALALLVAAFVAPSVHARPYPPPEPGDEQVVHAVSIGTPLAPQTAVPDVFERAVARHTIRVVAARASESAPTGEAKNQMPFTRLVKAG
jgi:hypothetical protein